MAKKVIGFIKLQIPAGQANPAPPVGPALGQQGVNIMDFCKSFNAKTQDKAGDIIPVEITVYADRSFSFITKTPPAARLILKSANISKGSSEPNKEQVGSISKKELEFNNVFRYFFETIYRSKTDIINYNIWFCSYLP